MGRATLAVTFALFAAALVACGGDDDNGSTTTTPRPQPRATPERATREDLVALAEEVGHDIYWAGPRRGYTYELSRTNDGNIFIRYLPPGVPVGAGSADFRAVGTYPQPDAFATVQEARKRPGEKVRRLPDGGYAVAGPEKPQSVYFAYPGSKLLIEVYDPSPARAMRLATSGSIEPVR